MSSDSESNSETEEQPNKKARYEEEEGEGEEDGDIGNGVDESYDEESEEEDLGECQQKKLKERGARTDAILRRPGPSADADSDEAGDDSGSDDEPFAKEQRQQPTNRGRGNSTTKLL